MPKEDRAWAFLTASVAVIAGLTGYAIGVPSPRPTIIAVTQHPRPVCADVVGSVPDFVVGLFRCDPDGWSGDAFKVTYRGSVRVWIANGADGLDVQKDGGTWGGVNGPDPEGQNRIWKAYQAWAATKVLAP